MTLSAGQLNMGQSLKDFPAGFAQAYRMLIHESTDQLLSEPAERRYLHVIILNALRDLATRLEIRFAEDGALLYYRVEDRDWELAPPPDELFPLLKPAIREVSRLVRPERPEVSVLVGLPGARYEPLEAGWLTYQLGGRSLDLLIQIDPREPFGFIRLDIPMAGEFAEEAGEALAEYAARISTQED
jgi:hypothetical protein